MKSPRLYTFLIAICLLLFFIVASCGDDDDNNDTDDNEPDDDDDDNDDNDNDDDDTTVQCESGLSLAFDLTPGARNIPFPSQVFTRPDPTSATGLRVNMTGQVTTYLDNALETTSVVSQ